MSDYIKRQDVIDIIHKEIENTKSYIEHNTKINIKFAVEELPTVDEKEIIRKAFERVVIQLSALEIMSKEETEKYAKPNTEKERLLHIANFSRERAFQEAIEIVKEECGINE